jgi:hypothetical protein
MFDSFRWTLVFLVVCAFLFIVEAATIFLSEKSGDRLRSEAQPEGLRTAGSGGRHHKAPTTT